MTQAQTANIDQIIADDPAVWALLNKIKLQATTFTFSNGRDYQVEPMQSLHQREACMKGTQIGFTEMEVLRSLHGLISGRYPRGVLYMFPTTDEVSEFSKSRFNPMILANKESIGQYVKMGGKGVDTTSMKRVGNSLLYLRGARLTQSTGSGSDEKESVKLRGIPVDKCIFDECDLMDEDVFAKARGRMGDSERKEEVYLSNPTLPGVGIDRLFHEGDQRHWHRRCGCGTWTSAELTFPECVKIRPDGTGYIGCSKCGSDIGPLSKLKGEWVPAVPSNSAYMHSRRASQLLSSKNDPADILREFQEPPDGNLGDVYRLRLGLPYVATEDKLTTAMVSSCCTSEAQLMRHPGPCAMGVDIGKIKHVVIGYRTHKERFSICKVIRVSSWNDIHDLAKKFNVKSAVIDARPYEDEARNFQKNERYRIYLCEYSENSILDTEYNDRTGIVKANRTQIFDRTHRLFSESSITIPRMCEEIKEFASQCCNAAKVLETNKKTGTSIYRYRKIGDEHYRNALNYFMLAASGSKIAKIETESRTSGSAVMEYELV